MSKLAIRGGEPVRAPHKVWPSWPMPSDRDVELVTEVVRSGHWAYNGPKARQFAHEFSAFSRAKYCLPVANGTVAVQLALEALDIGAYDEVIVPGNTWQATPTACIDVNAVPILVDIDPETYCLDLEKAEASITPRTRAILIVHLYGAMANMDEVRDLARRHDLKIIEDCAHQHGSQWNGQGVGTLGDVGAFSLQLSKVLTAGEGGIVVTQDWDRYQRLYSLSNCGRPLREGSPTVQSGNYRLTDVQAALLLAQMEHLEEQVLHRDANAQYLNAKLAQVPGIHPMNRYPQITRQSYYCFTFRYDSRAWDGIPGKLLRQALNAETGLRAGTTYEPLNDCALYQPHSKRRHRIDEDYWKAIDPARFDLPMCKKAYEDEAVVMAHSVLLADRTGMDDIARAVEKIYENREELQAVS